MFLPSFRYYADEMFRFHYLRAHLMRSCVSILRDDIYGSKPLPIQLITPRFKPAAFPPFQRMLQHTRLSDLRQRTQRYSALMPTPIIDDASGGTCVRAKLPQLSRLTLRTPLLPPPRHFCARAARDDALFLMIDIFIIIYFIEDLMVLRVETIFTDISRHLLLKLHFAYCYFIPKFYANAIPPRRKWPKSRHGHFFLFISFGKLTHSFIS